MLSASKEEKITRNPNNMKTESHSVNMKHANGIVRKRQPWLSFRVLVAFCTACDGEMNNMQLHLCTPCFIICQELEASKMYSKAYALTVLQHRKVLSVKPRKRLRESCPIFITLIENNL